MDAIIRTITDAFTMSGYKDVTVNVWEAKRIYVNLTSTLSFSYDLTQNLKISSAVMLSRKDFALAKRLMPQIRAMLDEN